MLMRRGRRTLMANRLLRLFGFVGIFLVLSIVGLTVVFLGQPNEPVPLEPGAVAHVSPGEILATPIPGSIQAGRPVTWSVRTSTHPVTGRPEGVVDDSRVYQMVEDDYLEGERWFLDQVITLTQVSTPTELLEEYFTGQRLLGMEGLINRFRDEGQAFRSQLSDRRIEVRNFSADGRQVYLGDSWGGGTAQWYSFSTGEVMRVVELPAGMAIFTMVYDPERGRWRSAAVRTPPVSFSGEGTP